MRPTANDVRPDEPLRHGAYVCLTSAAAGALEATAVPALAERLGLASEFQHGDAQGSATIAYLRRVAATPRDIADAALLAADAVVHVAAPRPEPVAEFVGELGRLLGSGASVPVLSGVVRPFRFTGKEMFNFAYAHRVLAGPGTVMPNAFLVPIRKSGAWWAMDWMRRHTYFLPRYDESGRVVSEGHALAAAAGIPALVRRTYQNTTEPAPAGEYDFVSYFECADAAVPVFHGVCAALRDVARNPEWAYVTEGPTWHGRRVAGWPELLD
jgi:hypothetical protein